MSQCVALVRCAAVAVLLLTFSLSCGEGGTEPIDRTPAALQIMAGDEQEGVVGEELEAPLVVRVENEDGDPVEGQLVNFRVVSGGGSVFAGSGLSNAQGLVQDRWTLGTSTAEEQRVEARAVDPGTGEPIVFATFTAFALPGPVATVTKVGGDAQPAGLGTTLPQPLVILARDEYENPVPDAAATWQVMSGGGAIAPASAATGDDGRASASWTLGTTHGVAQSVSASVNGHAVTFTATSSLPQELAITPSGGGQQGTVGTALQQPLSVRLTLPGGAPVAGVPVAWGTANSGGGLAPGQTVTNEQGFASATWTLGTEAGAQQATARVDDLTTVEFTATAIAGAPASATIVSGTPQVGRAGDLLAQPFVLLVEDQFGNPLADVPVSWTVTAGGGTLSSTQAATGSDGQAQTSYTLGPGTGQNEVRASVLTFSPLVFVATASSSAPVRMEKVAGDQQVGKVGLLLETPLTVRLIDQFGNHVPSYGVTARFVNRDVQLGTYFSDAQGLIRIPFRTEGMPESQVIEVTLDTQIERFTITPRPVDVEKLSENRQGCAIRDGGRLFCWAPAGQTENSIATEPMPGRTFKDVSIGGYHSCVVDSSGIVLCSGDNRAGQVGDGTTTPRPQFVPVASDVRFERVVTGALNACAITEAGDVYCWGIGTAEGYTTNCTSVFILNDRASCVPRPVEVAPARGIRSLSLNNFSLRYSFFLQAQRAFGLDAEGAVRTWMPVASPGLSTDPTPLRFVELDAGSINRVCGLTASGTAYCKGNADDGPSGDGGTAGSPTFVLVSGNHAFTKITTGFDHTCALKASGEALCWGRNNAGQLGDGTLTERVTPTAVEGDLRFSDIEAGDARTCGRLLDGGYVCWGGGAGWGGRQPTPWLMAWPED